jgi:predicted regulator of Ras-like GTPase activity (Roadblock/LC7/MglB family)
MNSLLAGSDSSLKERLTQILKGLGGSVQGLEGAFLVRPDGLIVASWISSPRDSSVTAAMSAAVLNIGANVMKQLELGDLKRVVVSGDKGDIVLVKAGESMILSVITGKGANLGMIFVKLAQTSEKLSRELKES